MKIKPWAILGLLGLLGTVFIGCGEGFISTGSTSSISIPSDRSSEERVPVLNGADLYRINCSSCHNSLDASAKAGRTAQEISDAINAVPKMQNLSFLTSKEVEAIAEVLGAASSDASSQFLCEEGSDPGPSELRRLSKSEYINTLKDLFGSALDFNAISDTLALIPREGSQKIYDTSELSISDTHITAYFQVATQVAEQIAASDTKTSQVAGSCFLQASVSSACVNAFIKKFGLRVLRRPLLSSEVSTFTSIYNDVAGTNGPRPALAVLLMTFLQSPDFLYHLEIKGGFVDSRSDLLSLTQYELASRLSYLIWGSMPDTELFQVADMGTLASAEGLREQIDRMYQDPRAKAQVRHFFEQWLEIEKLVEPMVSSSYADGLATERLPEMYQKEALSFVDYIVWQQKGDYQDLMTSTKAFVDSPELAKVFNVQQGDSTAPVDLNPQTHQGLLTRPALMIAGNQSTNPIHRGVRVLRRVLCEPIQSPDPDMVEGALEPPPEDPTLSTRERFETKTSPRTCQQCHSVINPYGFAFEAFDGLGRFRSVEKIFDDQGHLLNQVNVDSTAHVRIDGHTKTVSGPVQLSQEVAASQSGPACLIRNWHHFAASRQGVAGDNCTMASMEQSLKGTDGSIIDMLKAFAEAPAFRLRKLNP